MDQNSRRLFRRHVRRLRAALFLSTAILCGAAASRAVSMLVDGLPDSTFLGIWALEVTLAAVSLLVLNREKGAS